MSVAGSVPASRNGRRPRQADRLGLTVQTTPSSRAGTPMINFAPPSPSGSRPRSAASMLGLAPWTPTGCTKALPPTTPSSPVVSPMGHSYRFRLFPKNPHPLQLPAGAKSKSSPDLRVPSRVWTEEEKHWRRVALSPHGLFARNTPTELEWGSTLGHRFFELGMQDLRGMTPTPSSPSQSRPQTAQSTDSRGPSRGGSPRRSPRDSDATAAPMSRRPSMADMTVDDRQAGWKSMLEGKDLFDIRQGFRVSLLDVVPLPLGADRVWPVPKRERLPATKEETIKVYKAFVKMLELDGKTLYQLEPAAEDDDGDDDERRGLLKGIAKVSWKKLFYWVETSSYGTDVRTRCVYEALAKGLKGFYKAQSEEEKNQDVSLRMFFKWIWPFANRSRMLEMLTWIGQYECETMQLPAPPVISEKERLDITRLYHKLDTNGDGYCLPKDIAAANGTDWQVQLMSTIDEATVNQVLGDRRIDVDTFLELMCEDGFRGNQESTKAVLKDGRHVVLHVRQHLAWQGWVYAETTKEQTEVMRRAEAIESEVVLWEFQSKRRNVQSAVSAGSGMTSR